MTDLIEADIVNKDLQSDSENPSTSPDFYKDESSEAESLEAKPSVEDTAENVDYEELSKSDVLALRGEFPELSALSTLFELDDPVRYGALRDLGLTPAEAYLATRKRRGADNRSHLRPTRSVARGSAPLMTEAEMSAARELFSDVSDAEIRQLYKRVTK